MKIKLSAEFIDAVGEAALKAIFPHERRISPGYSGRHYALDVTHATITSVEQLVAYAREHGGKGSRVIIRDGGAWLRVRGDVGAKVKTPRQMLSAMTQLLKPHPTKWVYKTNPDDDTVLPWLVTRIQHHERSEHQPERCVVSLAASIRGEVKTASITYDSVDCKNVSAEEAITRAGYLLGTPEIREVYDASLLRYDLLVDAVGTQVLGQGLADPAKSSWWSRKRTQLDAEGVPTRMVVDVSVNVEERHRRSSARVDFLWWARQEKRNVDPEDEGAMAQAPAHTMLTCFDLRRHEHFHVHVDNVTVYEYDTTLADKLVLSEEITDLIHVLVSTESGYKDIVAGKGGGSIILCAGPPGVGKTLTAEVYAEAVKRPLYMVQCSQLGIEPEALEKALGEVLVRAVRWNAIILLDEADVYVMRRGRDLTQNAVVGVFLRVLERADSTLFLTTNRGDEVDDAIASRCIAKVIYELPTIEQQEDLWHILSETAGADLSVNAIEEIVQVHTDLSGRDIKTLIKLAMAVSKSKGEPIDAAMVTFVRRFKPA